MKPENRSQQLLSVTQSKAKMYEYGVPLEYHIEISRDPALLFTITIGLLGDLSAQICSGSSDENKLQSLKENLRFSARFFDAYLQSRLDTELDPYLLLLGAAAYYLCDLPGSSKLLIQVLAKDYQDPEALGIDNLLIWALRSNYRDDSGDDTLHQKYKEQIIATKVWLRQYFETGHGENGFPEYANNLRSTVYAHGSPRQLLYIDVAFAVIKRKIENSTWYSLTKYSDLPTVQWSDTIRKGSFLQELWPAQHLIGSHGVFRGKSAIIQMPTSAGKTRAVEIIIRSAFFSDRTSLAVIVAPFRALCHEIKESFTHAFKGEHVFIDLLSDVLQEDFNIDRFLLGKQILIVTPEKLNYIIRRQPDLAKTIGLIIYDEGHQFDNGTRGITYELLITSLKALVPENAQVVLISAVISNAEAVGGWLKKESEIVLGTNLLPTFKSIAFTSWLDTLGRLWFVDANDIEKQDFFVPRVIHQANLQLRGKERKARVFPSRENGQEIALYLGLKLVKNGSVAIFCGTKATATNLCEQVVDIFDRGLELEKPIAVSDQSELSRLVTLHELNIGNDAVITKSARMGIFAHHNNIPHGLRIAIEFAMKEAKIRFVVCTSTLSQGVNLPIRYLLVTGVNQGGERIGVRDFQNLIGRSGRSGMHTEGSIIFTDREVYDNRGNYSERWRWKQTKELLAAEHSEPVTSTLFSFFDPLYSDDKKLVMGIEPFEIVQAYVEGGENINLILQNALNDATERFPNYKITFNGLRQQIDKKVDILESIESFLLSHWDEVGEEFDEIKIVDLAKQTLAYYLANENQQTQIEELFSLLGQNISTKVSDPRRKAVFGQTLFGVQSSLAIEAWTIESLDQLISATNDSDLLVLTWPIISSMINNSAFQNCDKPEILSNLGVGWISGDSFRILHEILLEADARMNWGKQKRSYKVEHITDICENAISYQGSLVIGAIIEFVILSGTEYALQLSSQLEFLQKKVRYGLPTSMAIALYELGFSDRVISIGLAALLNEIEPVRENIIQGLRLRQNEILQYLGQFPSYFSEIYKNLTT